MTNLTKLLEIASAPIREVGADLNWINDTFGPIPLKMLEPILKMKNGFYAFEGALHVLSDVGTSSEVGLFDWNSESLWRSEYHGMDEGAFFFAEDVFGSQFCIHRDGVYSFDPETGSFTSMASGIEEWAGQVLGDYELWTGHNLARDWQEQHGALSIGHRLLPVTPFVLGGEFTVANLHSIEAVNGMRYRASIAVQIKDLPDGASVKLQVIE
ncbi:MAG: hypothetical protein WCF68_05445 [Terriglobales bacterium]